jgi:hypothetical protein
MFSLDAVDASAKHSMQRKVFSPEWLANTKTGDVLFQADYYLKELSMGEYAQPVVGMRSCFDFLEMEDHKAEWSAREWFLVRKAEVSMSSSNVLVPLVKMGVEAREQQLRGASLEDIPITRPDHPMVKYAEIFTKNFDLIAERRSVIFHLRELAKASVLAKFIQEARVGLGESWFHLGPSLNLLKSKSLQVPQLWNERVYSSIRVKDGSVIYDREKGRTIKSSGRGVYGGVSFGLQKIATSVPQSLKDRLKPPPPKPALLKTSLSLNLRSAAMVPRSNLMAQLAQQEVKLQSAPAPGVAIVEIEPSTTRGVDLRLDSFDLSNPAKGDEDAPIADCGPLEACVALGDGFWQSVEDKGTSVGLDVFADKDKSLLKQLFNPSLSDRRSEGECFIPPQSGEKYFRRIRNLLSEEESMRHQRLQHFLGDRFALEDPGPLFPTSWKPTSEISGGAGLAMGVQERRGTLQALCNTDIAVNIMKHASPVFDKRTEDGVEFRIYQAGLTEVRTTQKPGDLERVGAVFSIHAPVQTDPWDPWDERVREQERPVKVSMYVEWAWESNASIHPGKSCQYFVVFEAEEGDRILTEQYSGGKTSWIENPEDLEARIALAKVYASTTCTSGLSIDVFDSAI